MGAGDWVTGGLRRAVSGVKSAMPGQAEDDAAEETAAVLVADPDAAQQPARCEGRSGEEARGEEGPGREGSGHERRGEEARAATRRGARGHGSVTTAAPKAPAAKPRGRRPPRRPPRRPLPQPVPDEPAAVEPAAVPAPTWTDAELDGFRAALETDIRRLREELNMGAADMADLLADSSDGAGDDQADAGSKTLEREQEMSVNANARDLLDQSTHALRRLEAGTYGDLRVLRHR